MNSTVSVPTTNVVVVDNNTVQVITQGIQGPAGPGGTVTSVAVSGADGINVAGSPITSSGIINLSLGDITPTSITANKAYFKDGYPWADVRAWGAVGNGSTDDTSAFQNAINYLQTIGGGTLYVPPGVYVLLTGITITNSSINCVRILGAGLFTTALSAGTGNSAPVVTIDQSQSSLEYLTVYGKGVSDGASGSFGASYSAVKITANAVNSKVRSCYIIGGLHAIENYGTDTLIDGETYAANAYGSANIYTANQAALWLNRVSVDQSSPHTFSGAAISARATTTSYSAGDMATSGGYIIQATVPGTTGSGSLILKNYGQNMVDSTVTWQLVSATTFYGLQMDTGAEELHAQFLDASGFYYNGCFGMTNMLSGADPFLASISDSVLSLGYLSIVSAEHGYGLKITGSELQQAQAPNAAGVLVKSTWTSGLVVANNHDISFSPFGVRLQGGTNAVITGNNMYQSSGAAVQVDANVNNFIITDNEMGYSTNAYPVKILTGTSDHYTISGNDFSGTTNPISDLGSGTNKFVGANSSPALGVVTATTMNVGFSGFTAAETMGVNTNLGVYRPGAVALVDMARANNTLASPTTVNSGEGLGNLSYLGYDGAAYRVSSIIQGVVDGAVSSGIVPGKINFYTTDASGVTTNIRVSIDHTGLVNITGLTASSAVATDSSKNLISVTNTGTGSNVLAVSPALTGSPTAPTQSASDNSTKIATTAYVDSAAAIATASKVTTTAVSTNASFFPLFVASSSNSNQAVDLGTGLTFNPSTNTLATTTFSGAGTGLTGTASSLTSGHVTGATFTTALTVDTGTVTIHGNAANTSALTLGAGAVSISGSNTGDQTITLTGAVTGSGTGSFATTIATPGTLSAASTNSTATAHTHAITSSSAPGAAASLLATDASGIIGSTGTRIVKGWFADLTVTNNIAGSITGNAATVTTNANLTGPITSSGNATSIASQTGTGTKFVVDTSPTLSNPIVGTQATTDNSTLAASTAYVTTAISNAIAGVNPAISVTAATTAAGNTSAWTYNNGVGGIGATLTGPVNTAITIDGILFNTITTQSLLVKNDTQSPSGAFNGIYTFTAAQTVGTGAIFTRRLDYDTPSDINNTGAIPVVSGTVNGTTSWLLTSNVATVGTSALTYTQFSYNPTTIVTTSSVNVVTNAMSAQMAANTIKGNNTGGTANAANLTATQVQGILAFPQIISGNTAGFLNAVSFAGNSTNYFSAGSANTTNINGVPNLCPVSGTFKNLYIATIAGPGGSDTYTVTLIVNGSDTSVVATQTGAALTANDTTHTASVTAGQTWYFRFNSSATAATVNAGMRWGIEFVPAAGS